MNFLFLRGQVPQDRNPNEIVFSNIKDCDDMWTLLAYSMTNKNDYAELWYWGGSREQKFRDNFVERWIPNFKDYTLTFKPDVIFCRGGFPQYHSVLERYPEAIKIYYGAGSRYLPLDGFSNYDIILQDSEQQLKESMYKFPESYSTLFIKPAADNLFKPVEVDNKYDICFPANGAQKFKGHSFVYSTVPSDLSILNIGNNPRNIKYPSNVKSIRLLRHQMAKYISCCKVGILAVESSPDSCPRVLPEMLACGLPVVALSRSRFWHSKYIVPGVTGELSTVDDFWDTVKYVLNNITLYKARQYYESNLNLEVSSKFKLDS